MAGLVLRACRHVLPGLILAALVWQILSLPAVNRNDSLARACPCSLAEASAASCAPAESSADGPALFLLWSAVAGRRSTGGIPPACEGAPPPAFVSLAGLNVAAAPALPRPPPSC